jgi:triacylglycerol esterase/lipase EstA (alpha/beta hydrolase family)
VLLQIGCGSGIRAAAAIFSSLLLTSCAHLVADPSERATMLAAEHSFYPVANTSGLKTLLRRGRDTRRLAIYIEGDGAPWPMGRPPHDPTPPNPLALKLAITHGIQSNYSVAYIGRPCQFLSKTEIANCSSDLWTDARFSDAAVNATSEAIDALLRQTRASQVHLVGYSGGGTMAALLTVMRDDVSCLVTVAAPLDTDAWTSAHGVTPLTKSLNPAKATRVQRNVSQTHFQGVSDNVVPYATTQAYREIHPQADFELIADYDHDCCWEKDWATKVAQMCR